jgi:hypothetical protein
LASVEKVRVLIAAPNIIQAMLVQQKINPIAIRRLAN